MRIGKRSGRRVIGAWVVSCALAAAIIGLFTIPAAGDRPVAEKKKNREIGIMERTIDEVLVDSRNILVQSRSATEGFYVGGVGAVFTFSMDLVHPDWWFGGVGNWFGRNWSGSHVHVENEDDRIVIYKRDGFDDEDEDDDADAPKKSKKGKARKISEDREDLKREARERYEKGRAEIVDALVDYGGETLASLPDDESVIIVARLSSNPYFADEGLRQLVVRARLGDLRAQADGRLSRDALTSRITIEES